MATSKPRVRAYVDHDTYAKLQFATTRPHVSISDTVNNALKVYLSDEYSMERDSAILRRLDRMTRENERFNQKLAIQSEALAGFMLYFMRVTPQPPEAEKAAAIARGDKQFDDLIDNLKKRLESTSKSLFGTFEDVYADESGQTLTLMRLSVKAAMRYKSDTEITDAEIKASLTYVAGLIERQGDTYWPLVERLDHELLKRRKRARRLKRLLKSSNQFL